MFKARRVVLLACLLLALPAASGPPASPGQLTGALRWRSVGPYIGGRVTAVAGVAAQAECLLHGHDGWRRLEDRRLRPQLEEHLRQVLQDQQHRRDGGRAVRPGRHLRRHGRPGHPQHGADRRRGCTSPPTAARHGSTSAWARRTSSAWIVVDPHNPDVVYAAALGHLFADNPERGVYKTTDGGQTWKKILYVDDETGAIDLAMDPSNPQVLYAAMWQMSRTHWTFSSGGPGSGIYKTTDGGANWTNITHARGCRPGSSASVGLAMAPSSPTWCTRWFRRTTRARRAACSAPTMAGRAGRW